MTAFSPASLLRVLAVAVLVCAWALLAHYGSAVAGASDFSAALATTPLLAIVVMLLWRVGNPLWLIGGGLIMLAALASLWPSLRQNIALLYFVQHFGTNLALGALFGRSLLGQRQALVTQFALLAHNGQISPAKARYTRQVTIAWSLFFFLTATLSALLFWLAPASAWSVFANLLSTPLLLLMFAGEHLCRQHCLPPADRSSMADSLRGYRAARQRRANPMIDQP